MTNDTAAVRYASSKLGAEQIRHAMAVERRAARDKLGKGIRGRSNANPRRKRDFVDEPGLKPCVRGHLGCHAWGGG